MPKPLKYPFDMLTHSGAFIFLGSNDGTRERIAPAAYAYGRRYGFKVSCRQEDDGLRVTRLDNIQVTDGQDATQQ